MPAGPRLPSAIALLVAAAIALAAAVPARGAPAVGTTAISGNLVPGQTIEERTASYRRIADAGVSAVRIDFPWIEVEPQGEPRRDWSFERLDAEVEAISRAGMKVIGILAYGHPDYSTLGGMVDRGPTRGDGIPPFYVGSDQYFPPDDPQDFAAYAAATAAHFGDEVIAWEVWNEQNGGWRFWAPHEDPAAYADLLCATYAAVKPIDPETPVLFGGVFFPEVPPGAPGQGGPQFVRNAYAHNPDLGDCYDAMAYHPYPYPFTAPELDVPVRGSVLSAADQMREAMPPADRAEKPLWITEVGWPTHARAYGVSEQKQAQYLARMQIATFADEVPLVTWYTWGDGDDPSGANQEAHFGFFRSDGTAKPAVAAMATFNRVLGGATLRADLSAAPLFPPRTDVVGGRRFAYEYETAAERVVAVWWANESVAEGQGQGPGGGTLTGQTIPVEVPVSSATVTVTDHLGTDTTVAAVGGKVSLEVGAGPLYVREPR
ncbi:MAG TPA: cellulase family glycosylhydrolase [Thermoleophilaceae bacterium]|nr:cellulase family glycosylhydrolase [Thermoleophilaceae bacterium]